MTFKTTKLRDAITFALAVGATALAGTGVALAQETAAPADQPTELDRIEVTGSRIRQVDVETAAPVLLIDRSTIERQGFKSVADILQNIPTAGSPAISRTSPLSSGESVGGYYIDLRNLGPNRTLILVNGKRLGITNDGLQDVASIPAAMVERIEVLKDGASTIYGSDAIAGVVNIITRQNFEGAEANAYLGQWSEGDGTRQVYDFVMGFTGDRGSVTAGVEHTQEDPVWARDRWFSRFGFPLSEKEDPLNPGFSGTTQWGTLRVPDGGTDASGNPTFFPNLTLDRGTPGLDPRDINNYRPLGSDPNNPDVSNPAEQSTVYSGIERKSVFLNASYDIADWLNFESDILYTDRESFAQNAGYPFNAGILPPGFNTPISIDSYYNPVGNQSGVANPSFASFIRRGWEVPRQVRNNLTTFRFTGAFSGSFEIGEKFWDWDVGYLFNENKGTQISTGNLNIANVRRAVGASFLNEDGIVQCGTPDARIPLGFGAGQCTPWNPLIPFGYGAPGDGSASDPNVAAFLYQNGQALSQTETTNYFANVSGTLATLPAGDLGVAVGVEHRKESGFFSPDAISQTGGSTDLASGPTSGGYDLDEIYAELQIPVLADIPGAQELTFSLASRYSDYSNFGNTTNNKFGLKWKPIDSLLVRGTYADGFRAPDIASLFGGLGQSFSFYTDPCDTLFGPAAGNARCLQDVPAGFRQRANTPSGLAPVAGTQTNTPFLSGSNALLTPEVSESKTLGLVWSPGFAENLNVTLDWWNIRIENTIIGDAPTTILADCYVRGIESRCNTEQDPSRSRFTRDPITGAITTLIFAPINAGYVETEGFDFDVSYGMDTDWGRLGLVWQSSYVSKNELKTDNSADNPPSQLNGFGGNFRLRSNASLSWDKGDFGMTWSSRYYSGVKSTCFDAESLPELCTLPDYTAPDLGGAINPQNELGSNTFHDVQVRYNAPWNATVSLGANNVFEHYAAPDYDRPNSGYSYYGGYDIGRFIYFKYQQRF